MKGKNKGHREKKKKSVFGEKKRRNKVRRQMVIAKLVGGNQPTVQRVLEKEAKVINING